MNTNLKPAPQLNPMRLSASSNLCVRLIAVFAMLVALLHYPLQATADEADVVDVQIAKAGGGKFRIDVTVKHADTGWDHYANKWEVVDEAGNVLGTRVLAHPHVNEQPFTRSLTVKIPESITTVIIRAGDSVHELGGAEQRITVPH